MSDTPRGEPSIGDFADNLVPLLDALKIKKVVLGGHHTGAAIAIAFAARHPDRVAAAVVHGVPFYNPAERAERLKAPGTDRTLKPDGSHLSEYYKGVLNRTSETPTAFDSMRNATWSTIDVYLFDRDVGHDAAFTYEMEPDLKKVAAPTLVLTDVKDTLHGMDLRTVKLRPDFEFKEFSKTGVLSLMNEPKHWAEIAVAFAKAHPAK
jgi:pimeloyl-ACP methyl ester carboxylesterase